MNTAYYAPGGPGYTPYVPPAQSPPVYTAPEGQAPYATDTQALEPLPNTTTELPSYSWEAPLDTEGLNFPDSPSQSTPPIDQQVGMPSYNWEAPLDTEGFKFPQSPSASTEASSAAAASEAAAKAEASNWLSNLGKFLWENFEVGVNVESGKSGGQSFPSILLGPQGSSDNPIYFSVQDKESEYPTMSSPLSTYAPEPAAEGPAPGQGSGMQTILVYGVIALLAYTFLVKK